MGKYDDIINLPHHRSDYHKPMPMSARAAQFAPFAALSGHDEAIAEAMRTTQTFKELTDEEKNLLSRKLKYAFDNNAYIEITFFTLDKTKSGNFYRKIKGRINKIDEIDKTLNLDNGNKISIDLISGADIKENK